MSRHTIRAVACGGVVLAAMALAAGAAQAQTVKCSGPFAQCASDVGAFCEIENGRMKMWYKDREGSSTRLEECMGRVYEANGRPNPYKPASPNTAPPKR